MLHLHHIQLVISTNNIKKYKYIVHIYQNINSILSAFLIVPQQKNMMLLTTKQAKYGINDMEGKEYGEDTIMNDFFADYNYLNDDLKTHFKNAGITLNQLLLMNDEQILAYNQTFNDNTLTTPLILLIGALKDYKSKRKDDDPSQSNAFMSTVDILKDIYINEKYGFVLTCFISSFPCVFMALYSGFSFDINIDDSFYFIILYVWIGEVIYFLIYFMYIYKLNVCLALFISIFVVPAFTIIFIVVVILSVLFGIFGPLELMYRPYQFNIIKKTQYKECKTLRDVFETIIDKRNIAVLIIWIIMLGTTYSCTALLPQKAIYTCDKNCFRNINASCWNSCYRGGICGVDHITDIPYHCIKKDDNQHTIRACIVSGIWLIDYFIICIGLYKIIEWKILKSIVQSFIVMIIILGFGLPFTILGAIIAFISYLFKCNKNR